MQSCIHLLSHFLVEVASPCTKNCLLGSVQVYKRIYCVLYSISLCPSINWCLWSHLKYTLYGTPVSETTTRQNMSYKCVSSSNWQWPHVFCPVLQLWLHIRRQHSLHHLQRMPRRHVLFFLYVASIWRCWIFLAQSKTNAISIVPLLTAGLWKQLRWNSCDVQCHD